VNRLTLEAPPFLLPPSPAFEDTPPLPSSSTKSDDYEIPDESEEKLAAEVQLAQKAVSLAISEKETNQSPNDDAEDQIDSLRQPIEAESQVRPTPSVAGEKNPLEELAKKINGIQHIDPEPDSNSNLLNNKDDPPKATPRTSLKELKSDTMQENRAVPIKLNEAISPPPTDPQEKTTNQKSSEKLSTDKPVKISKKSAPEISQEKIVGSNKKNPLKYFGLSFLFLALAIGMAWVARQILFPTKTATATVMNSSASHKNQFQDAKNGKGSLISVTQANKFKEAKTMPSKASHARKKN
jgi:hypothetical protein